MKTFTVSEGRLKGAQIQARDETHAKKLYNSRLKRLKDKEMTFTREEIRVLVHLYDTQVESLCRKELQEECESQCGYFGITSLEQADSIGDKLAHLERQIFNKKTNKEVE